jgi:hypothetical protein
MASILRVNTLTDASSNNSTAMSTINQGTAKAWSNVNGTGTIAINDSFNVSGVTDNGTGDITNTFSSGMSNTSYVMTISGGYVNDDGMARQLEATANWKTYYYNEGTRDAKDGSVNSSAIHGDLA